MYKLQEIRKFKALNEIQETLITLSNKKYITRRIIAAKIDYTIFITITYFYILIFGSKDEDGAISVNGIKALLVVLFWFLYFCLIETSLNATLGNYLVNLKPVDLKTGNKITFKQSFLRHIVDPIDLFLFGIVEIIIIKNSAQNQRFGDLLANTKVIKI